MDAIVRVLRSNLFFAADFDHDFKAAEVHAIGLFSFGFILLNFSIAQDEPDGIDNDGEEDCSLYIEAAYAPVGLLTISIVVDLNRLVVSVLLVIDSQVGLAHLVRLRAAVLNPPGQRRRQLIVAQHVEETPNHHRVASDHEVVLRQGV